MPFQMIREDDLQHLHLFTDYGRLAMEDDNEGSEDKPFQVRSRTFHNFKLPDLMIFEELLLSKECYLGDLLFRNIIIKEC